jgi:hypothetical protein
MPLNLTRETLYAEVWRRPIRHLARRLGVSAASIRAACEEMYVPMPALDHWSRVRAGATRPIPPLPEYDGPTPTGSGYHPNKAHDWNAIFRRPPHLLSVEEVVTLTDRKWPRLQREQLDLMGLPYAPNAAGEPLVPVAAVEGRMKQARVEVDDLKRKLVNAMRDELRRGEP